MIEILSIILCISSILMAIWTVVVSVIAFRTVRSNFVLQEQMGEYQRFFEVLTETLINDTAFLRSEIVRDLPLDIPKYSKLNSSIVTFENRLVQFREAVTRLSAGKEW